ncbi:MAG: hypothetical protein MI673_06105, partial [Thiotrichales bacterium]|nr:hypothetical protein [Thiotrichales bacterium]
NEALEGGDDDDDEEDEKTASVVWRDGVRAVKLTGEQQQQSGIRTAIIETITLQHEVKTFSRVIDIQPLLEFKEKYEQVISEKRIVQAKLDNSSFTFDQLQRLNRETSNVSSRKIQEVEAQLRVFRETIKSHELKLESLKRNLVRSWGNEISRIVLDPDSERLRRLLNGEEVLLLLSLKGNQSLSEDAAFIFVNRSADRLNARKAYIISEATLVDPLLQGETYYLRTNAEKLRIGMRLHSWIESHERFTTGSVIPSEAVVWHAGQSWVYVKTGDELFVRMALIDPINTGKGVLVQRNLKSGDVVVVSGAQTLLSEENRYQIPDEDDD